MKHGIVLSIEGNAITIIDAYGVVEICDISPRALISLNQEWVDLGDIKAGDEVALNGDPPMNSVRATRQGDQG